MRRLLFLAFIFTIALTACNGKGDNSPSSSIITNPTTTPVVCSDNALKGIMSWTPTTTLNTGETATVLPDGYLVMCQSGDSSITIDVGNVTEVNLGNLIHIDGAWACEESAYRKNSDGTLAQGGDPSNQINFTYSQGCFY